jgi:hypothetical protein
MPESKQIDLRPLGVCRRGSIDDQNIAMVSLGFVIGQMSQAMVIYQTRRRNGARINKEIIHGDR